MRSRETEARVRVSLGLPHSALSALLTFSVGLYLHPIRDRHWKEIEISSCKGLVHTLISQALSSSVMERLEVRGISLSQEVVTHLARGIAGSTCRIQRLSLFKSQFEESEQSLRMLSEAFSICPSLQALDMAYCSLKDEQISTIVGGLCVQSLRHLDLSGNYCRIDGTSAITKLLMNEHCILETLDLTNQHAGEFGGSLDISMIGLAVKSNNSIKHIDLSFNMIYDDDTSALVASLSHNTSCESLNLMSNQLTTRGACMIAKYLPKWHGITRLSLSCNKIGEQGAEKILEGLKKNYIIEDLNMNRGFPVANQICFYLALNKVGRRIVHNSGEDQSVVLGLWPLILARANKQGYTIDLCASVLFHMLRRGPALFSGGASVGSK